MAQPITSGLRWPNPIREKLLLRGKLTPAGSILLAAILSTGIIAFDTESSLAYQSFAFLACLLFFALAGSLTFRTAFRITRQLPRFGTVGEPLNYQVQIHNPSARDQHGLVMLEQIHDATESVPGTASPRRQPRSFRLVKSARRSAPAVIDPASLPPIPARGSTEVAVRLTPLRRGPLQFGTTRIARTDPFGLIRAFTLTPHPEKLLILPRRYAVPDLQLPGNEAYQIGGVSQASAIGASEEFVSLRDYRRGDPLRHIHWRSWAKIGEPIVKEFEDEYFVRHGLILDTFDERDDPDLFEEAVSVASSFACSLRTQESLLDLMFVGVEAFCFSAGRGIGHNEQVLEILACARVSEAEEGFARLQELALENCPRLAACVCVFLKWDDKRKGLVEQLLLRQMPLRVFVIQHGHRRQKLDPGPLAAHPDWLQVLEVGRIEEGLAATKITP